jgi:hypothetical protein
MFSAVCTAISVVSTMRSVRFSSNPHIDEQVFPDKFP